jgi:hypothetical protein
MTTAAVLLLAGLLGALSAHAQLSQSMQDWMRRIDAGEFSAGGGRVAGVGRWMDGNGSPINFVEGLKGRLPIIPGTGDDSVHFQGTQRLLHRLIALNKQFHFMEYPNRRLGVQASDPVYPDTLRYSFVEEYPPPGPR